MSNRLLMQLPALLKAQPGESPADHHNRIVGPIVAAIVKPIIEAGGDYNKVLVVLESVLVGTMLTVVKLGGDEIVLDAVVAHAKTRLAEMRLSDLSPAGHS